MNDSEKEFRIFYNQVIKDSKILWKEIKEKFMFVLWRV